MKKSHEDDIDFSVSDVWREYYSETKKPPNLVKKSRVAGTYMVGKIKLYKIEGPLTDEVWWAVEENSKRLGLLPPPRIVAPKKA